MRDDESDNNSEPDWAANLEAGLQEGFGAEPSNGASVLARLEKRGGSAPRVLLRDEPGREPVLKAPDKGDAGDRYQIHGEIARGGVGIVLKGRDVDLGRDVAMKVIRPEHSESGELLQRFIEEAQIGGQLQHPGIVPVYELGMDAERRAFFTMKLIKGDTLAALLKARSGPDRDRRRFLSVFEQICQTVAYAHARGVVHRDLKPANVMVGAFGEVQVVDWGFAKVMARGGIVDERLDEEPQTVVKTVRTGSSGSESRAGSVMGTPAFMPPEQALGQTDLVDERSDVFALGAILCEILTGKPPYTRPGSEIFMQAAQADLEDAWERLDACTADAELVALCRRCLDKDRANRPADAGKLAAAVSAYLSSVEERAREAEVEAERAKVKAVEERKARKLTLGLAASIVVALLVGGGSFFLVKEAERRREQQAAEAVSAEMVRAAGASREASWDEALGAARNAVDLAEGTEQYGAASDLLADVERQKARAERNEELLTRLAAVRMKRGEESTLKAVDEAYAESLADWTPDLMKESGIAAEIAAYLDEWIWIQRKVDRDTTELLATANEIDPDPWRNRLREAVREQDRDRILALAVTPDLDGHAPNLLARHLAAIGERERAIAILRLAQRQRPADFWLNYDLGFELTMVNPPQWDEAIGFFRVALASRQVYEVRHQLGIALFKTGRYDDAIATWQEALDDDGDLHLYDHIIEAHEKSGKLDDLIETYRKAAALHPDDWVAHFRLGRAYECKFEFGDSIEAYRRAIDLNKNDPDLHTKLGYVLVYDDDVESAIEAQKTALEIDPEFALAVHAMSLLYLHTGKPELALETLERAIEIDPFDGMMYLAKAPGLFKLGRIDGVQAAFNRAVELDPENTDAYVLQGVIHRRKGHLLKALENFQKATRMPERIAEGRFFPMILGRPNQKTGKPIHTIVPPHPNQRSLAYSNLGAVLFRLGRWNESVAAFREALRRAPDDAASKATLTEQLRLVGQSEEAAELQEAVHEALGDAYSAYFAGFCRLAAGQWERGAEMLQLYAKHPWLEKAPEPIRDRCIPPLDFAVRIAREIPEIRAGEREWATPAEQALAVWATEELGYSVLPARLFEDLVARAPEMANEAIPWPVRWTYRSYGVIAAILASRDLGLDAKGLTDKERAHWRRKALEWMKLDLADWQAFPNARAKKRQCRQWMNNGIYAFCRDPDNVKALPADEQQEWRKIWREVEEELAK